MRTSKTECFVILRYLLIGAIFVFHMLFLSRGVDDVTRQSLGKLEPGGHAITWSRTRIRQAIDLAGAD